MINTRSLSSPESSRSGLAVVDYSELVPEEDRPSVRAYVNIIAAAPGAGVLVWGEEAICIAYNRDYRVLAGIRMSALGKPLFRVQPELERAWRVKVELALAGQGSTIDPPSYGSRSGEASFTSEPCVGWVLPLVTNDGASKGALLLFCDLGPALDPLRRLVGAIATDLRDPLIGIRVLAERLARAPKLTTERCAADLGRVLDMAAAMERMIDDMSTFARFAVGGAQLNLRLGDLGVITRSVCDALPRQNAEALPLVRVSAVEARGAWDDDAIARIITNLVLQARDLAAPGSEVLVDVATTHEGAVISVRYESRGAREDDIEQFFESGRARPSSQERWMNGAGLGLVIVREFVHAHRGRVTFERSPAGFATVRVVLPMSGSGVHRR